MAIRVAIKEATKKSGRCLKRGQYEGNGSRIETGPGEDPKGLSGTNRIGLGQEWGCFEGEEAGKFGISGKQLAIRGRKSS